MTKMSAHTQSHCTHPLILSSFSSVVLFLPNEGERTQTNLTTFILPLLSALSLLAFVSSSFSYGGENA